MATKTLWKLTKTTVRYGLAGGLVYYTTTEGLWGTADESITFFSKISKEIPAAEKVLPQEFLDQSKDILDKVQVWSSKDHIPLAERWNSAVFQAFQFSTEIPQHVSSLVSKAGDSITTITKIA